MPTNSIEYKDDGIYYNGKPVPNISSQTEKTTLDDNDVILLEDSADSNNKKKITKSNFTSSLVAGTDGQVQFNDSGSFGASANLHWDKTNGRLGVGTASPNGILHIYEDRLDTSAIIEVENADGIGTSLSAAIVKVQADTAGCNVTAHGTNRVHSRFGESLGGWGEVLAYSANGLAIGTDTSAPVIFGTHNLMAMYIDSSQKVGIGTTAPSTKLDINGNLTIRNAANVPGEGSHIHFTSYGLNHTGPRIRSVLDYANVENSQSYLVLSSYWSEYKDELTLRNGKVGIGTTTPSSALEVNGTTLSTDGFKCSPTGGVISALGDGFRINIPNDGTSVIRLTKTGPLDLLRLENDGTILTPYVYSATVGATNRDLFIDSTGKLGYVASSQRYKENIQDLSDVNWIHNLRPVTFDYINKEQGTEKTGLIAEEVEKVNPKLVSYNQDNQPETVLYSELVTPLLKEIQELRKEIEELKTKL